MTSMDILVIILSVTLALFLILAIVLVINLIQIAKQVRRMSSAAERAMVNLESLTANIQRAIAPALFSKFLVSQLKAMINKMVDKSDKNEKGERDEEK